MNDDFQYKERVIKKNLANEFRLGEGKISDFYHSFWGR